MIHCEDLIKIYKTGEIEVQALQGLDLNIENGEMAAIVGNSGSGKSTLLNMIGGLDTPSAGKVFVNGKNLAGFTEKEFLYYRRKTIGFIWQNNARNLIPYLTARQNVELPMKFAGCEDYVDRATEFLRLVGLADKMDSKLSQLSGGETQRVAISIALGNDPKLLLGDEPTGSLDTQSTIEVLNVFRKINKELGITVLLVTHDPRLAQSVDRVVAIRDGRCSSEFLRKESIESDLSKLESSFSESHDEMDKSHEEMMVIDKVGRLQIPSQMLDEIGIEGKDRVFVRMGEKQIIITKNNPADSKNSLKVPSLPNVEV